MRELRPQLTALINSLHCNWHSTMDITLTGNDPLFLSTGEIFVDRFGKTQQYLARIKSVEELSLSLDVEADTCNATIGDVDNTVAQTLSTEERKLDGAKAILGVLFLEKGQPVEDAIWDAKIPTVIVQGEISDTEVKTALVSVVDSIIISGRTIAEEFQWREPISNAPLFDSNDIRPIPPGGGPRDPDGGGRYRDFDPITPFMP